jgi:hypothetical protein
VADPQEGVTADGTIVTGADRSRVPAPFEPLGSLGLVLNSVVLWTTVYLDAAVRQLRTQGYPVLEEDMARLSPFVRQHLGVHGTYSFVLPDLAPGAIRELRNPDDPRGRRRLTPER